MAYARRSRWNGKRLAGLHLSVVPWCMMLAALSATAVRPGVQPLLRNKDTLPNALSHVCFRLLECARPYQSLAATHSLCAHSTFHPAGADTTRMQRGAIEEAQLAAEAFSPPELPYEKLEGGWLDLSLSRACSTSSRVAG